MPAGTWSKKDERQYKAIVSSCRKKKKGKKKRSLKSCKSMAAATVNKFRQKQGRTKKAKKAQKGRKTFFCLLTGMFRAKRGLRCFTTEQARENALRRGVFGTRYNVSAPKDTKASDLYVRSKGRGK